jgi:hypothetical protein
LQYHVESDSQTNLTRETPDNMRTVRFNVVTSSLVLASLGFGLSLMMFCTHSWNNSKAPDAKAFRRSAICCFVSNLASSWECAVSLAMAFKVKGKGKDKVYSASRRMRA